MHLVEYGLFNGVRNNMQLVLVFCEWLTTMPESAIIASNLRQSAEHSCPQQVLGLGANEDMLVKPHEGTNTKLKVGLMAT